MDLTQPFLMNFTKNYSKLMKVILQSDGIRINRETYLRAALSKYCFDEIVELAIETTPNQAGVLEIIIELLADTAIQEEATNIEKGSFITGLPGGVLGIASTFGEMAQYICFSLKVIQKLVYLYGGDDFFEETATDYEIEYRFTFFLGMMFGLNQKSDEFKSYARYSLVPQIQKELFGQVIAKSLYGPLSKKFAKKVGINMTKNGLATNLARVIPIGGAYVTSKFARAFFVLKAENLQKFLKNLEKEIN